MIVSSGTKKPQIHASAYVAPNATISGDVTIEEGCAILFGAVVTAEGAPIVIGANSVIMEHAVVKASGGSVMQFPCTIGESCIIGPSAFVVGATIDPGVFIASGARVTNGSRLESGTRVGIAHVAHGDPAVIYAPAALDRLQREMHLFQDVFNVADADDAAAQAAERYARFLRKTHAQDGVVVEPPKKGAPKPVPKSRIEEPPPAQNADVGKVVDVMFVELEEARLRREAAVEREKKGKRPS